MQVSAIVLAAGKGKRFKSRVQKPLFPIAGKPLVLYSLEALSRHPKVAEIVLVVNRANRFRIEREVARHRIPKVVRCVLGGLRRQDSVRQGFAAVSAHASFVLVHDAARPFIDHAMVSACIAKAVQTGAAIVGVPVKATIKRIAKGYKYRRTLFVKETLKRQELWEAQTPQVFKATLLRKALSSRSMHNVTDDASLVEKMGRRVGLVMGSYRNIKITTPEDARIAEALV